MLLFGRSTRVIYRGTAPLGTDVALKGESLAGRKKGRQDVVNAEGRGGMTLRSLVRTLIVKWYVMIPGLLLSLAMAGVTFSVVAPTYSSSGVAVLVQPKQQGGNSTNPLLNFDPSLNTTASIMIQSLNSPVIAPRVSV